MEDYVIMREEIRRLRRVCSQQREFTLKELKKIKSYLEYDISRTRIILELEKVMGDLNL